MRLRWVLLFLVLMALTGCAAVEKPRLASMAVPDDLRDAPAAFHTPVSPGEAIYDRMFGMEQRWAAEAARLLSARERELVLRHILRTKGREKDSSWRFELNPGLSQDERDFIRWYLATYSSYDAEEP